MASKMRVRLTVSMNGTVEQEMTEEEFKELEQRLEADDTVTIGDGIDIDWDEAMNAMTGEIEEVEKVKAKVPR